MNQAHKRIFLKIIFLKIVPKNGDIIGFDVFMWYTNPSFVVQVLLEFIHSLRGGSDVE